MDCSCFTEFKEIFRDILNEVLGIRNRALNIIAYYVNESKSAYVNGRIKSDNTYINN